MMITATSATLIAFLSLAQPAEPPSFYTPDEARQLLLQGASAYEQADYDRAIELWNRLVERGYGGADVLYNLGTAALRKDDLGQAVLYLERARRAGGDGDDLLSNLALARARQADEVVGAGAGETFLERLALATPRDLFVWAFLAFWLGGFTFVFLFRALKPGRRTWAGVLAGTLLVLAIPTGGVVAAHVFVAERIHSGVVTIPTLQARELPTGVSRVSFEVHAGLKVRLLETEGRYVRIRLPNGLVGWAEREGITRI